MLEPSVKPFPWPSRTLDLGATAAALFFNLLLVYAFLSPTRAAVVTIVQEKELALREGMRLLGLKVRWRNSVEGERKTWAQHGVEAPGDGAWRCWMPRGTQCMDHAPHAHVDGHSYSCRMVFTGPAGQWHTCRPCSSLGSSVRWSRCIRLSTPGARTPQCEVSGFGAQTAPLLTGMYEWCVRLDWSVWMHSMCSAEGRQAGLTCAQQHTHPALPTPCSFTVLLAFLWLAAAALLMFAYCLSTLFSSARIAGTAGVVVYVLAMLPG